MAREAEEFRAKDVAKECKIEAKSGSDNYCFTLGKNQLAKKNEFDSFDLGNFRMAHEDEKFRAEDQDTKCKILAKKGLGNYMY